MNTVLLILKGIGITVFLYIILLTVSSLLVLGLKPCIIGIILATGLYIIFHSSFGDIRNMTADWTVILLTAVLGAVYFGSRKIRKTASHPLG